MDETFYMDRMFYGKNVQWTELTMGIMLYGKMFYEQKSLGKLSSGPKCHTDELPMNKNG